jgi:heptosyltransferase-2
VKTLLRATNWVGDVVMSLPALRALRSSFPKDHLAILCRPWVADLYRLRPEVDEVIVEDPAGEHAGAAGRERLAADLRARSFDRAIILPTSFGTAWTLHQTGIPERTGYCGEGRSSLLTRAVPLSRNASEHQVFRHLRLVEAAGAERPDAPDVSWSVGAAERESASALLRDAGLTGVPFAAAHVASFAHAAKRWDLARFAEVFDRLAERRSLAVVLLGSAGEAGVNAEAASLARRARVVDLSGKSRLPDVLGLLAQATLFLGNDSGLAHLAGAAGAPTVVVFGSTDPDATRPWDGPRGDGRPVRLALVRRRTLCAPCRFAICPIDHACMSAVTVEHVAEAIERVAP